jgi:hypothetical protein
MGKFEVHINFSWGNLKGRYHLLNLGVDGMTVLGAKTDRNILGIKVWTGFIWSSVLL